MYKITKIEDDYIYLSDELGNSKTVSLLSVDYDNPQVGDDVTLLQIGEHVTVRKAKSLKKGRG